MKKALIYTNYTRDIGGVNSSRIAKLLEMRGVETKTCGDDVRDISKDVDMIIAVGGDGTILRAAKFSNGRPVLGINAGSIGFMTAFDAHECETRLSEVLDGNYVITDNMLLEVKILREGKQIGAGSVLNDVVVMSGHRAKTVTLDIFNDGRYMARVRGDGLIAATPTGSTAYSMSAGGPVVDPALEAVILTPICSHNVSASSFVLAPGSVSSVKCAGGDGAVAFDGADICGIETGDEVFICKSEKVFRLIRLQNYNFYDIIKKKLFDGR